MTPGESLSQQLSQQTRTLHRTAERTEAVRALLRGTLPLDAYVLWMANLQRVYASLEGMLLDRAPGCEFFAWLSRPSLLRHGRIAEDLQQLHGPEWKTAVPELAATANYLEHLQALAGESPAGLLAHAWVRYMGDVSGGQVLAAALRRHYGLEEDRISFYAFPQLEPPDEFRGGFRARLDRLTGPDASLVAREALEAFERNIQILDSIPRSPGIEDGTSPTG